MREEDRKSVDCRTIGLDERDFVAVVFSFLCTCSIRTAVASAINRTNGNKTMTTAFATSL